MTKDRNLEIARLQKEIGAYIGMGQDSLMFLFVFAFLAPCLAILVCYAR